MIRRRLALALVLVSALPACGSSPGDSNDTTASTGEPSFAGTYEGSGSGPIDAIRFDSEGYGLIPTGCVDASCIESGTYAVDAEQTSLSLADAKSGVTTTMSLSVLGTGAASTTDSLRIDDLVQPSTGGGSVVNASGGSLVSGTVSSALVNGQQVALVYNIPANIKPGCTTNIPTGYGDPNGTKAAAYAAMCPQGIHTTI